MAGRRYEEGCKYDADADIVCGDIYIIAALGLYVVEDSAFQWRCRLYVLLSALYGLGLRGDDAL